MNALTFDIDWSPDCALDSLRQRLRRAKIRATFLVTHPTDILSDLRGDGHELGIHPNFAARSSQGESTPAIIEYLLKIVPDARLLRTHGLIQSSQLFAEISQNFPQLELDLSLFTYRSLHCEQTAFHFNIDHPPLYRMNYNWEDDIAFSDPEFEASKFRPWGEDHIFDFHPIHVYLNSAGVHEYLRLKEHLGERPLTRATKAELDRFRSDRPGIDSYFDQLLSSELKFEMLPSVPVVSPLV